MTFDRRLRRGLGQDEIDQLHDVLTRLSANVGASVDQGPPWRGLVDSWTATTPHKRKGTS